MSYNYQLGKKAINEILDEKVDISNTPSIPKDGFSLTYKNGIRTWVGSIFVDIVDSSTLFKSDKVNKNVLARILRCFTREIIKILHDDPNYRDIGIRGDCVYGIYSTSTKEDLVDIFRHAYCINSFMEMLNKLLEKRGYPQIKAGIGLGCGEDIVIKAGLKNVEHDFIWIGDSVVNASKLSNLANRKGFEPICMDTVFYSNIIDIMANENPQYKNWIRRGSDYSFNGTFYQCNIIQTNFTDWIRNGMHDQ